MQKLLIRRKALLIATTNPGKFAEIKYFLSDLPVAVVSLMDLGIKEKVEEDGKTFEENAERKAAFYGKITGLPTIADDGGLEIDFLGGEPGMKTRRWVGGKETSDEELINYTLEKLKGVSGRKRKACLIAVLVLAFPDGQAFCSYGKTCGLIAEKPYKVRTKGYPFRSLLYLPKIGKYYHQDDLTPEENERYNHRGHALKKLKRIIKEKMLK